jgi:hypothetical protein
MAFVKICIAECNFALTAGMARCKTVGDATVVERGDVAAPSAARSAASSATQRIPRRGCERTNSGDMAAREALALRLQSRSARKNDKRA